MSFSFNFPDPNFKEVKKKETESMKSKQTDQVSKESATFSACGFISEKRFNVEYLFDDVIQVHFGELPVSYISMKSIRDKTDNETLLGAEAIQSDLLPGKYEGGFKIWECSFDLAEFLANENCIHAGQNVLELGCGAGLPGIIAYLKGASVTFQDFNSEVLELITMPNTFLNTPDKQLADVPCRFLFGDWGCIEEKYFSSIEGKILFDIILTSETIYEKSCQKKLLSLMKSALKPDGVIYLAAKIHYFGVGGGILDFENLVENDKTFEISTVHRIMEGVERQILKMKFRKGES